jgi:hypothetical protein
LSTHRIFLNHRYSGSIHLQKDNPPSSTLMSHTLTFLAKTQKENLALS